MSKPNPTTGMTRLEDAIVAYVKARSSSTLRAKYFNVGNDEGRREYAEWLAAEITALDEFIEESDRG